jgi:T5SS/PEP-CTERM-associated repeat protein
MRRFASCPLMVCVALSLLPGLHPAARAAITWEGGVSPADPTIWTLETNGNIGNTVSGTLRVDSTDSVSHLLANDGYIGYGSGVTGAVTIEGGSSTWTTGDWLYVGYNGTGTLNIADGGAVSSQWGAIACWHDSVGSVTVNGSGSTWTNSKDLSLGYLGGNGTLNIGGDASVVVVGGVFVGPGYQSPATGTISFDAGGGTLTAGALCASPSQLVGTGKIIAHGLVSDVDLRFDASNDLIQTRKFNELGQDISLELDLATNPEGNRCLGAGWKGTGSLTIQDAKSVASVGGEIASLRGSVGTATVDGSGSTWNVRYHLAVGEQGAGSLNVTGGGVVNCEWAEIADSGYASGKVNVAGAGSIGCNVLDVGFGGSGILNITDGGAVSSDNSYIGNKSSSTGVVKVAGAGSKWTNGDWLNVGLLGSGTLNIAGGGLVTTKSVFVNNKSLVAIDVGGSSKLKVNNGAGTITNNGTVRIMAGAVTAAGAVFSPIAARTWKGTGKYQALGGKWNASTHKFTASAVQLAKSGQTVTIDLAQKQRILTHDGVSNWTVGESFLSAASSKLLTFKSTVISGSTLTKLNDLDIDDLILGGWTFVATRGYTAGNPVYLSFDIGTGYSLDDLQVWRYSGSSWSKYDAGDLNCFGKYASFTISGLGTYAMTDLTPMSSMMLMAQPAPEPGAIALLLTAAAAILGYALRKMSLQM